MDLAQKEEPLHEQTVLEFEGADEGGHGAPWRPIHYLGSKLRVLGTLDEALGQVCSEGDPVCDLFAGSGTVSAWLGRSRRVAAVDIQEYSRVICNALLNGAEQEQADVAAQVRVALDESERSGAVFSAQPLIEHEESVIARARDGDPEPLASMLEAGSLMTADLDELNQETQSAMRQCLSRIKAMPATQRLSTMALRHFGGVYFSFKQAAELDVLLDLAAKQSGAQRDMLTAAVLASASDAVNTVGKQFAQPIRPRDKSGRVKRTLYRQVARDRHRSISESFLANLQKLSQIRLPDLGHKAVRADYADYLSSARFDSAVVYADPPYTRDHYSRFYHVLETLALRDDPDISTNTAHGRTVPSRGVYRLNRHQSPFCIRSQAEGAFDALFSKIASRKIPLILSYSPYASEKNAHPRVMTIDAIRALAKDHFDRVEVESVGEFFHSRLNRSDLNKEVSFDAEYLFICR